MLKIRVTTDVKTQNLNCASDWEQESWKIVDFASAADKKWFMNHMTWAVHNNRRVIIDPVESN